MNKHQYIDLDYINKLADGDTGFIIEMINDYKLMIPEYIADLNNAASDRNADEVKFYAHKLASSFMIMGAKQLNEIVVKIEHNIKGSMTMDELFVELKKMNEVFMKVLGELEEELNLLRTSN